MDERKVKGKETETNSMKTEVMQSALTGGRGREAETERLLTNAANDGRKQEQSVESGGIAAAAHKV